MFDNGHFNYFYIKIMRKTINGMYKINIPRRLCTFVDDNLEKYIQNRLKKHLITANNKLYNNKSSKNSGIIWLFWWQGKSKMPKMVNLCIKSIKKHSNSHNIILIDKYNVKKYTDIPNYIYEKMNEGKITLTHFSDILRFNLLKNYGGLWIDSTVLCTSDITQNYFNNLYTSGGYKNTSPRFVNGKWTGFLIGGDKKNNLFNFMDNYFKDYWKYNNYQIDYFLIDQGLYYAYLHNIGNFKYYVDNIALYNNPHLFDLVKYLGIYYDKEIYDNMTSDTNMFKLTYKLNYSSNNTLYSKLLKKY